MNSEPLANRLQSGTKFLIDIVGDNIKTVEETVEKFAYSKNISVEDVERVLTELLHHVNVVYATLEYEIGRIILGKVVIATDGIETEEWPGEIDWTQYEYDPNTIEKIEAFLTRLSRDQGTAEISDFVKALTELKELDVPVDLNLYISVDKNTLVQDLVSDESIRVLLYIFADKFLEDLNKNHDSPPYALLMPEAEDILVLLLGDVQGEGTGPNVMILGRDRWTTRNYNRPSTSADHERVFNCTTFRKEECQWDSLNIHLTPFHLHLNKSNLKRKEIVESFGHLRDALVVAHIANRTQQATLPEAIELHDKLLLCYFRGQKNVQVYVPTSSCEPVGDSLFKLFEWSYENHSSDKLGIVRQIISLSLNDEGDVNFEQLQNRSEELLITAKSNFQFFLKRSVDLYFDKRLKVSEYLQKFSQAVGSQVSTLTSELVSNVYKTVGVIISVVIAGLLKPEYSEVVAAIASTLYLAYLLFIILYWMPSIHKKYEVVVRQYEHDIQELQDILTADEINRLQGNLFKEAQRIFNHYYGLTRDLYLTGIVIAVASFLFSVFRI